ncbi:MAG: flagellar biosynthesis protein FlhA [Proteobacteria bacterium]|nr:flagellar biosynthesis protein FlhA [Pseudomonadota bacterium]
MDVGFAVGIACILAILFVPIPPILLDLGLACSISVAILILMVALWIERPLDFSAFPMVLLVTTMLRLALNVATTRLILSHGHEGPSAAGNMVGGFANLVMGGDFVIGAVVFIILLTVNFIVISKGATRIAEVGARFTLDAIPGKQMAIDADLNSGLIDEAEARRRRAELEQESSFYGSMDGASKFVRGDAVAGLIITFVNSFGGVIIGVTRHGMDFGTAADAFIKLTVGDGLVTQIPALIVSLAAGLVVSKGGNRGTADRAIISQLGGYPRALVVAAAMLILMALLPGLPFLPFATLSALLFVGSVMLRRTKEAEAKVAEEAKKKADEAKPANEPDSAKNLLRTPEIELSLGKQLMSLMLLNHGELAHRVAKMRKKFAQLYGFVVPEIKVSDDLRIAPKSYKIKIHGTEVASYELRPGELLVVTAGKSRPDIPGDDVKEPAFGLDALWVPDMFAEEVRNAGYSAFDPMSVMLTHLSEVVRNNLAQLLSYRDLRALTEGLEPEYKKLLDEITPAMLSFSSLQGVLKILLAERVSIRNLHLVLESIAEVVPHTRKPEVVAEHVRIRLAQQICGDISHQGKLRVLRLGSKWDGVFLQALKRDNKGEIIEFDIEPKQLEAFANEATAAIRPHLESGLSFALACAPESRPYVRMIIDRVFPNLPVLSHVEVAKAVQIEVIGAVA